LNDTFFQSFRITKVYLQIPGIDRCPRFEGIEIPKGIKVSHVENIYEALDEVLGG
jgi:hypothetical protein